MFSDQLTNFHALLSDEEDVKDSLDYQNCEEKRIKDFQLPVDQWMARTRLEIYQNTVQPFSRAIAHLPRVLAEIDMRLVSLPCTEPKIGCSSQEGGLDNRFLFIA